MSSVNDRINELIQLFHRGSVNAAAQTAGISQRTLARISDGSPPRADVLERLVQTYGALGVTPDWLLTGAGPGPQREGPPIALIVAKLHWDRLVIDVSRALKLPLAAHTALLATPRDMESASMLLAPSELSEERTGPALRWPPAITEAIALHYRSWIAWLEGLRSTCNDEELRARIIEHAAGFQSHFTDRASRKKLKAAGDRYLAAMNELSTRAVAGMSADAYRESALKKGAAQKETAARIARTLDADRSTPKQVKATTPRRRPSRGR